MKRTAGVEVKVRGMVMVAQLVAPVTDVRLGPFGRLYESYDVDAVSTTTTTSV